MRVSDGNGTVRSAYAADPDMEGIVRQFVGELPARITAMEDAFATGRLDQLRVLAHQMKGAAGGYGFPQLGELAALVDQGVKEGCDHNVMRSRLGMISALAARVRA